MVLTAVASSFYLLCHIALQHREALLAEIQSDEYILKISTLHTELREAGRFSVFLTAVRRVLEDIKQTRHEKRQWDSNAFTSDLQGGACPQPARTSAMRSKLKWNCCVAQLDAAPQKTKRRMTGVTCPLSLVRF